MEAGAGEAGEVVMEAGEMVMEAGEVVIGAGVEAEVGAVRAGEGWQGLYGDHRVA